MLDEQQERFFDQTIDLRVKVGVAFGHKNPWPSGTVITFADHLGRIGGQGYRQLGTYVTEDDRYAKLPFESVGIINEHKFGLDDYASRVNVKFGSLENTVHMWYWIAFPSEFLWVRYDWIKPWSKTKSAAL